MQLQGGDLGKSVERIEAWSSPGHETVDIDMLLEDQQVLASGKQLAIDVKEEWSAFRCSLSRVCPHTLCRERTSSNLSNFAAAPAPQHHSPYYTDMTVCWHANC